MSGTTKLTFGKLLPNLPMNLTMLINDNNDSLLQAKSLFLTEKYGQGCLLSMQNAKWCWQLCLIVFFFHASYSQCCDTMMPGEWELGRIQFIPHFLTFPRISASMYQSLFASKLVTHLFMNSLSVLVSSVFLASNHDLQLFSFSFLKL